MDAVTRLLDQIAETMPAHRLALRRLKTAAAAQAGGPAGRRTGQAGGLIRNDVLLARYRADVAGGRRHRNERLERILTLNGIRSQSGIATVTVITEPYPCPGRCVYCPTEARAPKSYLTNEPAVMRALRHDYDPCRQVHARLDALEETGHPTDKIELIIKGGTWSFYPEPYQRTFIQRCLDAANDQASGALEDAQRVNETARRRVIGLTIETRPDYVDDAEIRRLRELGVTRVELGVQTLEESVLELTVRDHGTAEVRRATALLKDAGFKVAYHLMPNLPGATPASDLESARRLFADPAYRPDALKLYPCVVIRSAELYDWWRAGRYVPYDDETLVELLIQIKRLVPPSVRIERVVRDIPSTSIQAGSRTTNLREEVQRRMRERGLRCRCIRCRQVRDDAAGPFTPPRGAGFTLVRRTYAASGGTEVFVSFEDPATDRLASLLRLRIPASRAGRPSGRPAPFPVLQGAALVRELHSYGAHLPLHHRRDGAVQHQGFGRRLMEEAERIAGQEFGMTRIAVIAGVGVREYYRRLGYESCETYMVKTLPVGRRC